MFIATLFISMFAFSMFFGPRVAMVATIAVGIGISSIFAL